MKSATATIPTHSLFCDQGPGLSHEIRTSVGIGFSFDASTTPIPAPLSTKLTAVWDTGAYSSVIADKIAQKFNFKPVGAKEIHGVTGKEPTSVYLVSIHLPNQAVLEEVEVMSCSCDIGCDILIGMDVITQGDFTINNHQGRTTFTFRMPSIERHDYTK